ncbi:MAG: DUF3482 domain-containing protein [Balneolaceae bacterium]
MSKTDTPVFVVTGAPNKGKSTFLKAMTNDPGIKVDEVARTTTSSKPYHFKSGPDGETLLTLWDTPGFENAAGVYEIIRNWESKSSEKPLELIRRYVETYQDDPYHQYETEIFKPLTGFACIIYIADCSKSFSSADYLREIQLLQFTNLPRIAILNPIDGDQHLDSWREGLRAYFHNIKVFNPHKTTFDEKLSILGALSHLHDEWEKQINGVIDKLKQDREQVLRESARVIRNTVLRIYDEEFEIRFNGIKDEEEHKRELLSKARRFVTDTMNESQKEITEKFGFDVHISLNREYRENDLFSETVRKRHVSPAQRGFIGAVAGGSVGALIDAAAGGLTFGVFTAIAGTGGYAAGYYSDFKPEDLINIKTYMNSDRKEVIQIKSLNIEIGFLIINRLRQVVSSLYNRTAANTEDIIIDKDLDNKSLLTISKLLAQISASKKERYSESRKKELLDFIHEKLVDDQRGK